MRIAFLESSDAVPSNYSADSKEELEDNSNVPDHDPET